MQRNKTFKHMLQRLPIAFVQVKAGNTSETLLNEVSQIKYLFTEQKELLIKSIQRCKESSKVIKHNEYYIFEF